MLALSVLPVASFAAAPVHARITGGLFQDFAPSPFHMHRVLAPLLRSMGADVSLEVTRPGYVPGGGGIIEMHVVPARQGFKPWCSMSLDKRPMFRALLCPVTSRSDV
jgi:RNA 3'-terminal phosphate cyclase (ATP)